MPTSATVPPITYEKPSQVVGSTFLRSGIYGTIGTGKTTVAASAGDYVEKLIERGEWVRGKPYMWVISAFPENVKAFLPYEEHFLITRMVDWRQLQQILTVLEQGLLLPNGTPNPEAQKPGAFFRAICFDTWTRILCFAIWLKSGIEMPGIGQEQKYIENLPHQPRGFDLWNEIGELSNLWQQYFCRLPIHTMWTYQEELREGKFEETPVMTGPALTPAASRAVREGLEILGRLYVEGTAPGVSLGQASDLRAINASAQEQRMMLLGKHDRYYTKGPTHALGYVLANPTWEKLVGSIGATPVKATDAAPLLVQPQAETPAQ